MPVHSGAQPYLLAIDDSVLAQQQKRQAERKAEFEEQVRIAQVIKQENSPDGSFSNVAKKSSIGNRTQAHDTRALPSQSRTSAEHQFATSSPSHPIATSHAPSSSTALIDPISTLYQLCQMSITPMSPFFDFEIQAHGFGCTVTVNDKTFSTAAMHNSKKAAKAAAAALAVPYFGGSVDATFHDHGYDPDEIEMGSRTTEMDWVSALQNEAQSLGNPLPVYEYMQMGEQTFCCDVLYDGQKYWGTIAESKKSAKKQAAKQCWISIMG